MVDGNYYMANIVGGNLHSAVEACSNPLPDRNID